MTTQVGTAAGVAVRPIAAAKTAKQGGKLRWRQQLLMQLLCLLIGLTVLIPIIWIVAMSLDPRNISKPDSLIPPGASLDAYARVIARPTQNDVSFIRLAINSIFIAVLIAVSTVTIGVLAAYAFSRMHFRGREILMIGVLAVLMLPAIATLAPLFVSMNRIQFGTFNLRASLFGVALAVISSQLPFAIWNIKGYLDTLPREIEEAASVDGANQFQIFLKIIVPMSTPVLAVTAFFGFIAGWTEFYFSSVFLTGNTDLWTLAVTLNSMVGQYAANTRWSEFAAYSILVALPVSVVYLYLQRYIISGLTVGGVKR